MLLVDKNQFQSEHVMQDWYEYPNHLPVPMTEICWLRTDNLVRSKLWTSSKLGQWPNEPEEPEGVLPMQMQNNSQCSAVHKYEFKKQEPKNGFSGWFTSKLCLQNNLLLHTPVDGFVRKHNAVHNNHFILHSHIFTCIMPERCDYSSWRLSIWQSLKTKFGWQTNDWKLREKANKETCIFLQRDGEMVSPTWIIKAF